MNTNSMEYTWTPGSMVEVTLKEPDDFLKIKETLTRIGIASNNSNTLYQSCHILHKRGKYFIVSFLELFILDGHHSTLTLADIERRNAIIKLLEDWKLLSVVDKTQITQVSLNSPFKVISHKDKADWKLQPKYKIGQIKVANKE